VEILEFAFYIDRRGSMTRKELVMQWTYPSNAFGELRYVSTCCLHGAEMVGLALHEPYIFAFCNMQVEVWNIETAKMVQKINGPYRLLNAPDSGDRVFSLSLLSGDVAEMVFNERGS
jgi:hypothetical protein